MSRSRATYRAAASALALVLAGGCAPPRPPAPPPAPLPELPTVGMFPPAPLGRTGPARATSLAYLGPPVTLTASNVDVRALLPALAEAAGLSLVLGPEVRGRVSVNFREVPARTALEAVLEQAGLGLVGAAVDAPWGPTVFYPVPVNIGHATAEMIQARFGVSAELARWVVEARRSSTPR